MVMYSVTHMISYSDKSSLLKSSPSKTSIDNKKSEKKRFIFYRCHKYEYQGFRLGQITERPRLMIWVSIFVNISKSKCESKAILAEWYLTLLQIMYQHFGSVASGEQNLENLILVTHKTHDSVWRRLDLADGAKIEILLPALDTRSNCVHKFIDWSRL